MTAALPPWLASALRDRASGAAGRALAARAADVSQKYRAAKPSGAAIDSASDALAYALTRLPATYAAVSVVFEELEARAPGFRPSVMLDAGAGPGTATWAAREAWPDLERALLVDSNAHLLSLAKELCPEARPSNSFLAADMTRPAGGPFDLVVAAYSLTELTEALLEVAATALWTQTSGAMVIVEPGRPREHARLMSVRDILMGQGARIVAPCPHENACPLLGADWCHFSVRLPRSREHMRLKGGRLGYEDEKFSYLIAVRPGVGARPAAARLIKPPRASKAGVDLESCTPTGLRHRTIASRDRADLKAARRLRWGDALD